MIYTPFIWPLILAAIILGGLALYARRYRGTYAAIHFKTLMWLGVGSALIYAHEISVVSLPYKIFLSEARYIPLAMIAPTLFVLALDYTGKGVWLQNKRGLLLFLAPAITMLLSLTGNFHQLFRYDFRLNTTTVVASLLFQRGPWWDFYYLYSLMLVFGACGILLVSLGRRDLRPLNTLAMTLGILVAILTDLLYVLGLTPIHGYYWTPTVFVFSGLLFGWALLRGHLFELTPIARNTVLENISDLALVLDLQGRLVDFNRSARRVCRLGSSSVGLSPLQALPPEWGSALQQQAARFAPGQPEPADDKAEVRVGAGGQQRVYELTVSPVTDSSQRRLGRLLLFHDITAHKQTEAQLHQSRERLRSKLEHLLSPDYDMEAAELQHVIDSEAIQALMEDFYRLTQIGVAIIDLKGNRLVATGWQDICSRFHQQHPETLQKCRSSHLIAAEQVKPGAFLQYKCQNNLWDIVTPIMVGERQVGNLYLGTFFYQDEPIDYEQFIGQAEEYGFDKKDYLGALERVPRWSREKVDQAMEFFARFATLVSQLSYSNLKLAQMLVNEEKTQAALRESEQRYRLLAENVRDVIWTMDKDYHFTYISPSIRRLRGLEPEEALQESLEETMTPESFQTVVEADRERAAAEAAGNYEGVTRVEVQQKCKDGSLVWVEVQVQDLYDEQGQCIGKFGVSRDISQRKQTELALAGERALLQNLLDTLPDQVYFKDLESRFIRINQAQAALFGLSDPAQALGKTDFDFFAEAHASAAFADEQHIIQSGEPLVGKEELEQRLDRPDTWASTTKMPLRDPSGKITGTFGLSRDITARKLTEYQLKAALEQKEVLLKEIHHRVKNNLAVISSLLDMQASASPDERLRLAFQDSQRRILAMARIHEQLYLSRDLEHIDMARYLSAFTVDLLSYDITSKTHVRVEVQDVILGIDQAIPCGLIINELVTNSLKYAFIGQNGNRGPAWKPDILVSMQRQNGRHAKEAAGQAASPSSATGAQPDALADSWWEKANICLSVCDNGVGLPAGTDLVRPQRLGLKLVTRLTSQLQGRLEMESSAENGTLFKITFPMP